MATHYIPVWFVGPTTHTATKQLCLFRLLNERRKHYKNGGQSTWADVIFIDKDVCSFLFSNMLHFFQLQITTIVVSIKIIFFNLNRAMTYKLLFMMMSFEAIKIGYKRGKYIY